MRSTTARIGAVIGHEISHGFDDQGAQYDGDGNLRDWWTKEDHDKFEAKTAALVAQYDAFEPVPGYHINGELTLGENIADNSGLAIAYKAYQISLGGKPAPVIDGLTGDQRFFLGFAQVVARQAARQLRDRADQVRPALDPDRSACAARSSTSRLLHGVRRQGRRQDVSRAGSARHHLVERPLPPGAGCANAG